MLKVKSQMPTMNPVAQRVKIEQSSPRKQLANWWDKADTHDKLSFVN